MLPNLAALRISEPVAPDVSDIDSRLDLLPDAVLSKVIKDTGNARSLCATADALKQTSRGFRDMGAWSDLAAEYAMPGAPAQNTVTGWRQHVLLWCDKIRTGAPEGFDLTYVQSALEAEMWAGTAQGYAWILSNGGTVPLAWLRAQASQNVKHIRNLRILELQLSRFTDGRLDKFRLLDQLITATVGASEDDIVNAVRIVRFLFAARVNRAHLALTSGSQLALLSGQAVLDAHIDELIKTVVGGFYHMLATWWVRLGWWVPKYNQLVQALVPEIEQIITPHETALLVFLSKAIGNKTYDLARWFHTRHPLTRLQLLELRSQFVTLNTTSGVFTDSDDRDDESGPTQGLALINEWIAALQ
jgi:hypothetical protein